MSVDSDTIATFNERNEMPNWVYNTLTIQGPKDQVDSIKERLNQPFTVLHDSWNMETNKMEISESKYSNPVFAFWNIHSPLEDGITMEEYVQQPNRLGIDTNSPDWFAKEVEHAKTQKDWYNWNTTNWGTKWDNKVVVIDDLYHNSPTNATIKGTAWGAFNALTERLDYYRSSKTGNSDSLMAAASGFDPVVTAEKNKILKAVKALA